MAFAKRFFDVARNALREDLDEVKPIAGALNLSCFFEQFVVYSTVVLFCGAVNENICISLN